MSRIWFTMVTVAPACCAGGEILNYVNYLNDGIGDAIAVVVSLSEGKSL